MRGGLDPALASKGLARDKPLLKGTEYEGRFAILSRVPNPQAYGIANSEPIGACEASKPSCASARNARRGA